MLLPWADVLAKTTNYTCNEWLDDSDRALFCAMKERNPRRYRVAGLGEWGIVDGLVYENWEERAFDRTDKEFLREHPNLTPVFGLDFGYANDPSALFCGLCDECGRELYVFDEMYAKGLSNKDIYNRIASLGYAKERIRADSAEPKSIDELRGYGLYRIRAARKGSDSVNNGIQFLRDFKITVHPRCTNFLSEISNYTWSENRLGGRLNVPADDFNHLMDAMRYAMEDIIKPPGGKFYNVEF